MTVVLTSLTRTMKSSSLVSVVRARPRVIFLVSVSRSSRFPVSVCPLSGRRRRRSLVHKRTIARNEGWGRDDGRRKNTWERFQWLVRKEKGLIRKLALLWDRKKFSHHVASGIGILYAQEFSLLERFKRFTRMASWLVRDGWISATYQVKLMFP